MTVPKKGDRVKVTVNGRVRPAGNNGLELSLRWLNVDVDNIAVDGVEVEVLASPVYVNHDTTEHRPGDVARDQHGCVLAWWDDGSWHHTSTGRQASPRTTGELTLLVRNGQVIAP